MLTYRTFANIHSVMTEKAARKRIAQYCNRFPSEASRATLLSELRQAQAYKPLAKWTVRIAQKRLRELEGKLATRSIVLKFQRLHRYFQWEIDNKYRKSNPVELSALPKLRDQRAPMALNANEVKKLFSIVPTREWIGLRDKLAISMMLVHGYRISTIVNMDWEHLDQRNDGLYLSTWAKNGVLETRRLRSDIAGLVLKYKSHVEEAQC